MIAPRDRVRIAVVGKYTELVDSYKSVQEALIHGGIANDVGVDISWLSSDLFTSGDRAREILRAYHGLLVPGGFGVRGVEGMVEAIRAARETRLPFFGICLGMQTAIIEFARNVLGLDDSHSSEFAPECENPVVTLMESQQHVTDMGGTMRLGAYPCRLARGSKAAEIYGVPEVSERHRHRYEVSNEYRDAFVEHGLKLSGAVARRLARRDRRARGSSVVHRVPVPSGAAVAADTAAPAIRGAHRCRHGPEASDRDGERRSDARRGGRLACRSRFRAMRSSSSPGRACSRPTR